MVVVVGSGVVVDVRVPAPVVPPVPSEVVVWFPPAPVVVPVALGSEVVILGSKVVVADGSNVVVTSSTGMYSH